MTETLIIEIGAHPPQSPGQDLDTAFAIRRAVFCVEQGVSEAEEMDGMDGQCRQYLAISENMAVGTARTRILDNGHTKIERVAVLKPHRRAGIGRLLMIHIMDDTRLPMVLNAQTAVADFYTSLGFQPKGSIFQEAGIEHIHMILTHQSNGS